MLCALSKLTLLWTFKYAERDCENEDGHDSENVENISGHLEKH